MSLEQLDAWLHTLEPAPRVDGTSMLDGYLTAIVIGPCSISPDEWFVNLLGERGRIATAAGTVLAAITAIVARFNAISESLSLAPSKHAPLFEKTGDGLALPHPWCMGFLSAMRLRFDEWRPPLICAASTTGCCCLSCSTAPTHWGAQCSGLRARDPKPNNSYAPPTTTSRSSFPPFGTSGCRNASCKTAVKPDYEVPRSYRVPLISRARQSAIRLADAAGAHAALQARQTTGASVLIP